MATVEDTNGRDAHRLAVIGAVVLIVFLAALALPGIIPRLFQGEPAAGPESAPLSITDIRVTGVAEDSATVTWRTNEPADSQIMYGKGQERDQATPRQPEFVTDHKVTIASLDSGTEYDFTTVSADKSGLIVSASGPGFRTHGFSRLADLYESTRAQAMKNLPPMGTGVAWADFNNDGRLDVFIASEGLAGSRLFRNTEAGFEDVTGQCNSALGGRGRQAAWADYNGDGYPDLLVTSGQGVLLFTNQGPPGFAFRDDSALLPQQRWYDSEGAGWMDYNNDGKPDIFVTNGRYGILVFENMSASGKPAFKDVSPQVGLGPNGFGAGFGDYCTLGDYNGDGRTDFLYNLYTGMLGRNMGARFEKDDKAGINYLCTSTRKLGTAFGDYDNDGNVDIFVPQRGSSKLYHNKGDGTFEDVAKKAGLLQTADMDAASAAWGDINNDGFLDLFVGCEGSGNHIFLNNGDGTFRDCTARFGMAGDGGRARGITFVDFDDDGDLDLYVHNFQSPDYFYENTLIYTDNHNFVKVKFAPRGRCPIGATVRLYSADGKLRGLREISGGQGSGCQEAPIAHFGAAPGRYKVSVRFTNGTTAEKGATVDPKGTNTVTFE